ncbi:unnamed protein product [Tilletia controversa]|uniref:Survival protein SurE-like phosphatase/nucleotidase domain-containing protein n=3 Tax=Tilletia TaxID=13289 RepID=A0A8X7T0F0_9BASI|nr:hypothetical protein CF336_g718 [Tilletia laevis]KAE8205089.1 hypothetical protein CF328_g703 [Tilletia controversa]KAE8265234.1 hypothetical protein A4X03_0g394 [Tilletia caries]KAE8208535.1 hypothetical protein CF335_g352 [Tilletia laevis]KAE8254710.1 hypothetical protein A4X06_0g776 [Tilletia controversa]
MSSNGSFPKPKRAPRVLLVNDDGPPSSSSPHVLPLYNALVALGWDVTVVLPSGQRSWGSMAFTIRGNLPVWYYYPLRNNDDGSHHDDAACWSTERRQVRTQHGELGEWVLIDGSPTTAANVGLFNTDVLFGPQTHPVSRNPPTADGTSPPFSSWADLVISGPNFGRNTGTAFALSSGTLGAALAGALSGVKSIAVSYGHFQRGSGPQRFAVPSTTSESESSSAASVQNTTEPVKTDPGAGHIVRSPPAPQHVEQLATDLTVKIVKQLWEEWEDGVQCYSVNVPLSWTLEEPKIYWTRMWENMYPKLFKQVSLDQEDGDLPSSTAEGKRPKPAMHLTFAPPMGTMLAPDQLLEGTDIWALMNGWVSIVKLCPKYTHVDEQSSATTLEQAWSDAAPAGQTASSSLGGPGTRWML